MKVFAYTPPALEPDKIKIKCGELSAELPLYKVMMNSGLYAKNFENFGTEIEIESSTNPKIFEAFTAALDGKDYSLPTELKPSFLDLCLYWECSENILKSAGTHNTSTPVTPEPPATLPQAQTPKPPSTKQQLINSHPKQQSLLSILSQNQLPPKTDQKSKQPLSNDSDDSDLVEVGPVKVPIFVKLPNGLLVSIKVPLDETIGNFKKLISEASSIPPEKQQLKMFGTELSDNAKPLSFYGLYARCKVDLVMKESTPKTVQTPNKPTQPRAMPELFPITMPKRPVERATNIPFFQNLFRTLFAYDKGSGTTRNNQILFPPLTKPPQPKGTTMETRSKAGNKDLWIHVSIPSKKQKFRFQINSLNVQLSTIRNHVITLTKLPQTYKFYKNGRELVPVNETLSFLGVNNGDTLEFLEN